MKILLFGGAFDPPHIGHINILEKALDDKKYDKVIIMPTANPGHKNNCVAPFLTRLEMSKLAFGKISDTIEFSDFEYLQEEKSYSYITINYLKELYKDSEITFLVGQDNILGISKWKNFREVVKSVDFVAFLREKINDNISLKIRNLREQGVKLQLIDESPIMISSTQIRENIQNDIEIKDVVNKEVCDFINQHKIYDKDDFERIKGTSSYLVDTILTKNRAYHTYNVADMSAELAQYHNLDVKKAYLSGLLHDIMKQVSTEEMLHRAKQSDIIEKIRLKPFPTLHGFAAADYMKKELHIDDEDMLWAVKSHTCGRAEMSDLEKIVYLGDMLCFEREFEQKEDLIKLAIKDLDQAMLQALKLSLKWLEEKDKKLDQDSLAAYNYFKDL